MRTITQWRPFSLLAYIGCCRWKKGKKWGLPVHFPPAQKVWTRKNWWYFLSRWFISHAHLKASPDTRTLLWKSISVFTSRLWPLRSKNGQNVSFQKIKTNSQEAQVSAQLSFLSKLMPRLSRELHRCILLLFYCVHHHPFWAVLAKIFDAHQLLLSSNPAKLIFRLSSQTSELLPAVEKMHQREARKKRRRKFCSILLGLAFYVVGLTRSCLLLLHWNSRTL